MSEAEDRRPDLATIREAAARIAPWIHRTPVVTCAAIDERARALALLRAHRARLRIARRLATTSMPGIWPTISKSISILSRELLRCG